MDIDKHGVTKALLREASYCPICYHINQETKRQFRWLFIEYARSHPYIFRLMKGGLCPVHSLEIMNSPEGQDMSLCYSYLIKNYRHKISALLEDVPVEAKPRSLLSVLLRRDQEIKKPITSRELSCPFCESQEIFRDTAISQLVNGLAEEEVLELYKKSPGLCRAHLEQAINEGDPEIKKILLQVALDKMDQISA